MLVKNIATIQKYAIVNYNFTFEIIESQVRKQERKHILSVIGRELYNSWSDAAPEDEIEKEVFDLLEEASSNLSLLSYTKVGIVSSSNGGLYISTSSNSEPAQWWQIKDLRVELLNSGMEAIDQALEIMEANQDKFESWVNSDQYTIFKELLCSQTAHFQKIYNISKSRLTFLALRPYLRKVEKQFFEGLLGAETLLQIKEGNSPEERKALEISRWAQVCLAIAEIAKEGIFELSSRGLFTVFEEIPGMNRTKADQVELLKIEQSKSHEGNEILKDLIRHLKKFPGIFKKYDQRENQKLINPVLNGKSIVSL
ncbi:DUF6712 family protein [Zunongwangia endophytica]|uniref:DUF6712 family protein n=1 Tax=Zunongwangia endophytica TaxID=1808945 RepID=A0ABV8H4Y0_9FLAO|nr:DUF6712 family protein [Zunongwangia endophytica]MDN3595321.1 hypothetical protein [Zunongwangia endophytica]